MESKKYYIAHIINDVQRQGKYEYRKIPLLHVIQYVGTDRNKAEGAIYDILYGKHDGWRYEELDGVDDGYFHHEFTFKYVPMKDGKDIELPDGCYGIYYADVLEEYGE